ncbi:sulfotransferase domain-containing protein [Alloyangia pacifica]|uniref:sulfotransferase domain-containing protein n=1 Tax=Alloyangia pacifica TaxID=311180 RepID=UPI001CFC6E7D|nr:sulfotransferase domain-containing protein [Alloyangia pacifica]
MEKMMKNPGFEPSSSKYPDFIYVGTGKVATTWLFESLKAHPEIFMTPVKETNYFDLNYQRGSAWYAKFFEDAEVGQVIGEISHRYLQVPSAINRIKSDLPDVKIVIGLRQPVDYCMSDYLFCVRNGRYSGTFSDWVSDGFDWESLEYKELIEPYINEFGIDRIFLYTFDQIKSEPQKVFDALCRFLDISKMELTLEQVKPVNAAAKARNVALSNIVNRASKFLKRRGGQKIIAKVKYNAVVQRILFKPINEKPPISELERQKIMDVANPNILWLSDVFHTNLEERWSK